MTFRSAFLSLLTFLALALPPARAQQFLKPDLVTASLLAESAALAPGTPLTVGVRLKMTPGWHTYWQFGGDSGAPTKIEWELPAGFSAGPIQWPLPTARPDEGDQLTYVYEDEVLLLVEITPPAQLPPGEVTLTAKVRWLACKETCIPGQAAVSLSLPVPAPGAPPVPAPDAALFAKWRALLPKTTVPPPFTIQWERGAKALSLRVGSLPADFKAEFFPIPTEGADETFGHPAVSEPAADGTRTITVPYEGNAKAWNGVIATQKAGAPREGWQIASGSAAPAVAPAAVTASAPGKSAVVLPDAQSLLSILGAAFLGGLILNLMPCVLPVIALKIFGFVQQAGEEPGRVFRLGLAFVAGVFAFFLGLAALVAGFQAAGHGLTWGFQFQNPYILAGLVAVVFVFALSMFGVFEITLGSGTATTLDSLSRKEGYSGAFSHGMFTTLLGTSCTAPFLGSVLGYAFAQPAAVVFLIFATIAAGMSLPYFLLTWQPAWMRFLPKPGAWMERLKQFMGFVLLSVALWLLSVLGGSVGVDAVIRTSAYLLLLGVAAWVYGFSRGAKTLVLIAGLALGGWFLLLQGQLNPQVNTAGKPIEKGGIAWQPFSPERLLEAVRRGQPVFIDFTADWCLNCKYNERFVLETDPVRTAVKDKDILMLKADWTHQDQAITDMLKSFGRVGVPAYVLYAGNGDEKPLLLPEILTQTVLLRAISQVKPALVKN